MRKLKKIISTPAFTAAAFVLAAVLLLSSGIGGTRAALSYYSETYAARVSMDSIGVTLNENGKAVSFRDYSGDGGWSQQEGALLEGLFADGEPVKLGARYPEELSVTNSGSISQYVRVSIYKYWTDQEGNKIREVSPDMICLGLRLDNGWMADGEAATAERTVLYFHRALAPGETSPLFADSLMIDPDIASKVTRETVQEGDSTVTRSKYEYNGYRFCVEARVDAVQEHNAQDAVQSAWGREVNVSDGVLSLR